MTLKSTSLDSDGTPAVVVWVIRLNSASVTVAAPRSVAPTLASLTHLSAEPIAILKFCGLVPMSGTVPTVVHDNPSGESCITNSLDDPVDKLICRRSANTAVVFNT